MLAWSFVNAKNLSYIYLWGLFRESRETTPWQDATSQRARSLAAIVKSRGVLYKTDGDFQPNL